MSMHGFTAKMMVTLERVVRTTADSVRRERRMTVLCIAMLQVASAEE